MSSATVDTVIEMQKMEGEKKNPPTQLRVKGGFQWEFVNISRIVNHMTCYKFECSHW